LRLILFENDPGAQIGESANAREMLEQVAAREWDLVLLDINLPDRSGLDVLAEIKQLRPNLPVLILSVSPEAEFAERTLRAGAAGYINKQFASDEILLAVRKVLGGGTYVTATIAEKLASGLKGGDSRALHEELSDREFQVFRLIALGRSVKEIAGDLALSEKTVGTYLARIREKTGLSSYVEITRYAFHHKLVE